MDNDSRWDAPSDSSEIDNTLMNSLTSGITVRETRGSYIGNLSTWGNPNDPTPQTNISIDPHYPNEHINLGASMSTITGSNTANNNVNTTPSNVNDLQAQNEALRRQILELQSQISPQPPDAASQPYTQITASKIPQGGSNQTVTHIDIQLIMKLVSQSVIAAITAQFANGGTQKSISEVAQSLQQHQHNKQQQYQ